MTSRRSLALAGMFLLFGAALPVHAAITTNALADNALTNNALADNALADNALTSNALSANALSANALSANALAANGSAIAELNGVMVEEISLPQGIRH